MNCQDISRLADAGHFNHLSDAERRAAEAHAHTCPRCVAVWSAHARLAMMTIPAMPVELAQHCRELVVQAPARGSRAPRILAVGGFVVLAAAASVLLWHGAQSPRGKSAGHESMVPATNEITAPPPASKSLAVATAALPPPAGAEPQNEPATLRPLALPLIPKPVPRPPDPSSLGKSLLALEKIVALHPEMVEGPALDDTAIFFVAVAMRADGTVLGHAAELASPATSTATSDRVRKILPTDGGESLSLSTDKGMPLDKGGTLRARVVLNGVVLPADYDVRRSDTRVREILSTRYDELMLPPDSDEAILLTVLLSDDGRVLREKVDRLTMQNAATMAGGGLGNGVRPEDVIASRLGINVEQVGQMGWTTLERGEPKLVVDSEGRRRVEGVRVLGVRYAWERRPGEPASSRAPDPETRQDAEVDLAAALIVVQQLLPGAFSITDLTMTPTIVFTARGEVIRAGLVHMRNGDEPDARIQEQLLLEVRPRVSRALRLVDKSGARAGVYFAWVD